MTDQVTVTFAGTTTVVVNAPSVPAISTVYVTGPKGDPGHSTTVYEQVSEPTNAVAGDVWVIP